jgi:hypothetical protein
MKTKTILIILFVLLSALASYAVMGVSAAPRAQDVMKTCQMDFEATVLLGPDTNTAIIGSITFGLDASGSLSGEIVTDARTYPIVGQVNGRAVNLAIELEAPGASSDGLYIFGTGTTWTNVTEADCGRVLGGTFGGPQANDMGAWLTRCRKFQDPEGCSRV